jgi:hypothetical protein
LSGLACFVPVLSRPEKKPLNINGLLVPSTGIEPISLQKGLISAHFECAASYEGFAELR